MVWLETPFPENAAITKQSFARCVSKQGLGTRTTRTNGYPIRMVHSSDFHMRSRAERIAAQEWAVTRWGIIIMHHGVEKPFWGGQLFAHKKGRGAARIRGHQCIA